MFSCFLGSGKNCRNEQKAHCSWFESFLLWWENHLSDLWLKRPLYQQQDLVGFLSFAQITMPCLEIETGQHQPTANARSTWDAHLVLALCLALSCSSNPASAPEICSFTWPFPLLLSVSRSVFLPFQSMRVSSWLQREFLSKKRQKQRHAPHSESSKPWCK